MDSIILLLCLYHQISITSSFSMRTSQQGSVFRIFQSISFTKCKFECKSKNMYRGLNYRRHLGLCMLLAEFNSHLGDRDPRSVFSAKRDWKQDPFISLCKYTCTEKETCNLDKNTASCTVEECNVPPNLFGNISQLGNFRQVGGKILYTCHGKGEEAGTDVTSTARNECKADGDWLYNNVTCMKKSAILYSYKGCFLDKRKRALNEFRFHDSNMTIPLCALTCYEKKQIYFGLEQYKQCFCGSRLLYEVPVTNCTTPCVGDPSTMCGGTWALAVYQFIQFESS